MNTPGTNPLFWIGQITVYTLLILWFVTDLGLAVSGPAVALALPLLAWSVTAWWRTRKTVQQ